MFMDNPAEKTRPTIRLTEYSHGAGCGCKIAPKLLEEILASDATVPVDPRLLVGNDSRDDAAVYDLGNGSSVISTTDFFMPIVDDPFEFGQIAATNAISDIYAMGGRPLMAIAIFGWPIAKLGPEVARAVIDGGRRACELAGITLAGGHSIDAPEPIFGLAVTGSVENGFLTRNDTAEPGCRLYLTKPLGIGILTTAQKQKKLQPEHIRLAPDTMCQLNDIGAELGRLDGVRAMTDVTGFGLLGHLLEMCEGSGVSARIDYAAVPKLPEVEHYLELGCSPGGAQRNFDSYGHKVGVLSENRRRILCDPQTSGGLLVAVAPQAEPEFTALARSFGLNDLRPIGSLLEREHGPVVEVE
ncbi:selenophosphate synthetase [Thiohalobacter thiocyanaticus]|uniref:Selenide, water dikinase n=2 Tax=Thiohalobacter thiocyanaticus TaxID=585455 RepID=A0A1Z4VRJ3_9GAMM|nr:selenophosphate synthetase [Thiohalobacter thiocyanaticus]